MSNLAQNIQVLRRRVETVASRAGRSPAQITIIAVTKTVPPQAIREAMTCGISHFGENRVQEAGEKIPVLRESPATQSCWHMIGHLQSNKIAKAIELFDRVDSVDGLPLLEGLNKRLSATGKTMEALLEVKLSAEASKTGLIPDEVPQVLAGSKDFPRVRIAGLMTVAPFTRDAGILHGVFSRLRDVRDSINAQEILDHPLEVLSMGMSDDFEIAIEEGATEIRIGRAIFGERRNP